MPRKSPFRHTVKSFTRKNGTRVDSYKRGKGKKARERARAKNRRSKSNPKSKKRSSGLRAPSTPFRNFHVSVTFPDGKREVVPSVNSTSYAGAINKGLTKRERVDPPKSILVRRII